MGSARSCLLTNKDDPDQPIITSKTNARTSQVSSPEAVAPKLLAWASKQNNKISTAELETKNELVNFDGVQLGNPIRIFQLSYISQT